MIVDKAGFPDGLFLGWAPGKLPIEGDDALVWRLEPGTDLVVQAHMTPSDSPRPVSISLGLFFTDRAAEGRAAVLQLGSKTIDIPAGARAHPVEDGYELPAGVDVIGIYPHAHYLCHEMQVKALLPNGREQWLLWIPHWDFYWQDEYRYREPVSLPRGTTITMRFVYDNSAANDANPFDPPRRIRFGSSSTDEMGEVLLMVVPRDPERVVSLQKDFLENELRQDIAGYQAVLAEHPDDARVRNALGFAFAQTGRADDAIAEWERGVGIDPGRAEAHYNLGGALAEQKRYRESAKAFRRAIRAKPDYAEAYNNLGVVLQSDGRLGQAIDQYRRAIEIRPGYARAHYTLAGALGRQGHLDEEIAEYRLAIEAKPDYAEALHNLGAVLLLSGRGAEAVAPLKDAIRVRPDYGLAYANLSRALAASLTDDALSEAELMFRKAIALRPGDASSHRDFGAVATRAGHLDTALTQCSVAVGLAPDDTGSLACLAWVLAVHPEQAKRDAKTAVRLAEKAMRLAPEPDAVLFDTLAAAYASSGRFERAVEAAERALAAARRQGEAEAAEGIEVRLELYCNETPYLAR